MNKFKITTIGLSAFFLFSCNEKVKTEPTVEAETEMHDQHDHDHSNEISIQLNNGQKWKVDDNMMAHIRNMEKEVTTFDKEKPENYQVLADNLKENLDLLTSNCTMKGQAHDELHKWLLPYIDLVDNFSDGKTNDQFTEIQHSFITFNQYFE